MRSPRRGLAVAVAVLGLGAFATPPERAAIQPTLTAADARADLDVLRMALEEAHGALDRFSSRAALERRFDAHRARVTGPVSQREFIGIVSEMLAEVRDGHTRLEYDSATVAALAAAPLFPLRVQVEDGRLVVTSNDTPSDSAIRPGMEIVAIDGRSAAEVIGRILPKLAGDGFIETGKRTRLGRTFGASYWLFVDPSPTFAIVARDTGGRLVRATLPGVRDADRTGAANPVNATMQAHTARLEGPRTNVSLRLADGAPIATLRIRAFDGEAYPTALDSVFRLLRERGTRALILDLRGNGGGVDLYGAQLVGQLTDRPFRYFDHIRVTTIRPSFATWKPSTFDDLRAGTVADPAGGYRVTAALHPGVAEQRPGATPFLGPLFVLLDGGTFSTSADVTALLREWKRATFVGEESAGTAEGNTSGLNALVVLPHSGLRLKVQMYGYRNAVSPSVAGRGTRPDVPVPQRVSDVLRGVDAPWERAMALARVAMVRR
jgi:hypothetical protein